MKWILAIIAFTTVIYSAPNGFKWLNSFEKKYHACDEMPLKWYYTDSMNSICNQYISTQRLQNGTWSEDLSGDAGYFTERQYGDQEYYPKTYKGKIYWKDDTNLCYRPVYYWTDAVQGCPLTNFNYPFYPCSTNDSVRLMIVRKEDSWHLTGRPVDTVYSPSFKVVPINEDLGRPGQVEISGLKKEYYCGDINYYLTRYSSYYTDTISFIFPRYTEISGAQPFMSASIVLKNDGYSPIAIGWSTLQFSQDSVMVRMPTSDVIGKCHIQSTLTSDYLMNSCYVVLNFQFSRDSGITSCSYQSIKETTTFISKTFSIEVSDKWLLTHAKPSKADIKPIVTKQEKFIDLSGRTLPATRPKLGVYRAAFRRVSLR